MTNAFSVFDCEGFAIWDRATQSASVANALATSLRGSLAVFGFAQYATTMADAFASLLRECVAINYSWAPPYILGMRRQAGLIYWLTFAL
jgi:hypothetical protein